MTCLEALRRIEEKAWATELREFLESAAGRHSRERSRARVPENGLHLKRISPHVENDRDRPGSQDVGGNDPGFGRSNAPRNLLRSLRSLGGRSRPRFWKLQDITRMNSRV
jgi:hypothetical protein